MVRRGARVKKKMPTYFLTCLNIEKQKKVKLEVTDDERKKWKEEGETHVGQRSNLTPLDLRHGEGSSSKN